MKRGILTADFFILALAMAVYFKSVGHGGNRKRVQRLMKEMRIAAIYPKPRLSRRNENHKIHPYLLKGLKIKRPNQVWSTDITYIKIGNGFRKLKSVLTWGALYSINFTLTIREDYITC